ncbi:MAG: DNA polymerase III subunit gamma/tau, partial [bacterium]|nr:DNA polymerase III subunit gamma/tau [bacterium]
MAVAIYRKYRPKKFGDLMGQEAIVLVLQNAARQDKIAHAYLFYGARGTGKTTAAR